MGRIALQMQADADAAVSWTGGHRPTRRYRYTVSRTKSDHADAVVLANILRTDMAVHRPLPDDSELVQAIAVLARASRSARNSRARCCTSSLGRRTAAGRGAARVPLGRRQWPLEDVFLSQGRGYRRLHAYIQHRRDSAPRPFRTNQTFALLRSSHWATCTVSGLRTATRDVNAGGADAGSSDGLLRVGKLMPSGRCRVTALTVAVFPASVTGFAGAVPGWDLRQGHGFQLGEQLRLAAPTGS